MEVTDRTLLSSCLPAPFGFGQHPDFERDFRKRRNQVHDCFSKGEISKGIEGIMGKEISLSELSNPLHPEVFIIPRDRFLFVVDAWGDAVGLQRTMFPFSSTDFYVEVDEEGLFYELWHAEPFWRLSYISQLGYLVPPRPEELDKDISIVFLLPAFPHNRAVHSLLVAVLMEVVLARNGFSQEARAPIVLTAGCHDIGIPAGGDSVKRVDPKNLDEEKTFAWVFKRYGLAKRWREQFGFNLATAKEWVENKGVFGQLLDVIDKICYTALDCYHLGFVRPGKVRDFCLKHPLVMDVWQDIQFAPDKTTFAFSQPENLFRFLLLRAYEYQELLYNPYSRALDLFLKKLVQPLYRKGIITKQQLLVHNDEWLGMLLESYYPQEVKHFIEPEELSWKRFETAEEQRKFRAKLGKRVDHAEHIAGFATGLDWLVFSQGRVMPLRQAISQDKVELLEEIVALTQGYYVYYRS